MPYKDPDRRAAYMRAYKGREKPGNPRKCYVCVKNPEFFIPFPVRIWFRGGFFITADPREQAAIEASPYYGETVFSWKVEPSGGNGGA